MAAKAGRPLHPPGAGKGPAHRRPAHQRQADPQDPDQGGPGAAIHPGHDIPERGQPARKGPPLPPQGTKEDPAGALQETRPGGVHGPYGSKAVLPERTTRRDLRAPPAPAPGPGDPGRGGHGGGLRAGRRGYAAGRGAVADGNGVPAVRRGQLDRLPTAGGGSGPLHGRLPHGSGNQRAGGGDPGRRDRAHGGHGADREPEQNQDRAPVQALPVLQGEILPDDHREGDHPREQGRDETGAAETKGVQGKGGRRRNDRPAGPGVADQPDRLL